MINSEDMSTDIFELFYGIISFFWNRRVRMVHSLYEIYIRSSYFIFIYV